MNTRVWINPKKKKNKKARQLESSTMATKRPDPGVRASRNPDNPIPPEPDPNEDTFEPPAISPRRDVTAEIQRNNPDRMVPRVSLPTVSPHTNRTGSTTATGSSGDTGHTSNLDWMNLQNMKGYLAVTAGSKEPSNLSETNFLPNRSGVTLSSLGTTRSHHSSRSSLNPNTNPTGLMGGHENPDDSPQDSRQGSVGAEETKEEDKGPSLLKIMTEEQDKLEEGAESTLMSPELIGERLSTRRVQIRQETIPEDGSDELQDTNVSVSGYQGEGTDMFPPETGTISRDDAPQDSNATHSMGKAGEGQTQKNTDVISDVTDGEHTIPKVNHASGTGTQNPQIDVYTGVPVDTSPEVPTSTSGTQAQRNTPNMISKSIDDSISDKRSVVSAVKGKPDPKSTGAVHRISLPRLSPRRD